MKVVVSLEQERVGYQHTPLLSSIGQCFLITQLVKNRFPRLGISFNEITLGSIRLNAKWNDINAETRKVLRTSSTPEVQSLRLGDTEVRLVELKRSGDNHYVIFPFTDTGLHISYHPDTNPLLQEEKTGRNLATLDIASARKLNVKDFQSMFQYPRHRCDVLVIPIDSFSIFEKMAQRPLDIPYPFEVLFSKRLIYRVRASTLKDFLAANRGPFAMIDPVQDALLIYGEGFEKWGPMRLGLHHPLGSRGMPNLFSIQYALLDYLDSNDEHVKIPEPSYTLLSEWIARLELLFSDVKILRWNKGGRIREIKYRDTVRPPPRKV